MTAPQCETLTRLAREVERLTPSHRDPHRFHECKSEIAHTLRLLAKGITPSRDGIGLISGPLWKTNVHLVPDVGKFSSSRSQKAANRRG